MTDLHDRPRTEAGVRPPPWRDVRVLRIVFQLVVLGAVAGLGLYLASNLTTNLRRQGISTDFDYLTQPAGFAIADSDFDSSSSVSAALLVGIRNTAALAFLGIFLATVLGIIVGIARLSSNWLVRRAAGFYVETLRNVPVLVVIIFVYTALVLKLPAIQNANEWLDLIVLSNSGAVFPSLAGGDGSGAFWLIAALALLAAVGVAIWRTRRSERTGELHRRWLYGGAVFAAVTAGAYVVLGGPVSLSVPTRDGLVVTGGIRMPPEFAAMLLALVVYTASHIAEIVRGSILAVPPGQSEAATALGLGDFGRLRYVVLPQAFRIMIPPLANQFLNLTKNSSLAIFIGYAEAASVTQIIISQGNPAPQAIAVLMLVYLMFSLSISAAANLVNRRLRLETR